MQLQWGHVFSDVEIHGGPDPLPPIPKASMGPRLFRRGNDNRAGFVGRILLLQWGHVFSDVEISDLRPDVRAAQGLQWGHVFSDVEMIETRYLSKKDLRLQWGHVFSDVEIKRHIQPPAVISEASMGPRLFRRGNDYKAAASKSNIKASMGPRLFRRGNGNPGASCLKCLLASMGPRLFRRGNLC